MSSTMSSPMNKQYDLITLGETMWRLSPPGHQRLEATQSLDVNIGGAESNIAINLARLGKRTAWWSRMPDSPLGHYVVNTIRAFGVDVTQVCWGGQRLGTYFVEFGSSPRPTQVIYDRAGSAASEMQHDHFDWSLLNQTRWLHLTGITPALSDSCLATVRHALAEAHKAEIGVSFDINYRAKLWSPEQAAPILDEIAGQSTLVICAERDARTLFNTDATPQILTWQLHRRWNGAVVVLTQGDAGAIAYDGDNDFQTEAFQCQIVDAIGAGDAFDAGLLCALMDGKPLEEALQWGTAVAALKMTMPGDLALVTRAEVEQLLTANAHHIHR